MKQRLPTPAPRNNFLPRAQKRVPPVATGAGTAMALARTAGLPRSYANQLHSPAHAELCEQRGDMEFYGALGEIQIGGDFLVARLFIRPERTSSSRRVIFTWLQTDFPPAIACPLSL